MKMTALRLANIITEAGVPCAIVGGAVRDCYFGATPKDFDIVVWSEADSGKLQSFLINRFDMNVADSLNQSYPSEDTDFLNRWSDWVKLENDDGLLIDLLKPEHAFIDTTLTTLSPLNKYIDAVESVLDQFDVSMNQQALLVHGRAVHPILTNMNACVELKQLPTVRAHRMKKRADILGLIYVDFPVNNAPYFIEEDHY